MGKTLEDFQSLGTLSDLAALLDFAPQKLSYILYKLNGGPNGQYKEFEIKKRSGGIRKIAAPYSGLKVLQKKLANALQDIYIVKKPVHGFTKKRSILSNAEHHSCKRFVFNIDLKDFFPSIHFGRVMGLFAAKPYEVKKNIAILIAKIACYRDVLPQGSPCSPIISNMICSYLDRELVYLAKKTGCFYTRYADDLTFSTNKRNFPEEIAICSDKGWQVGLDLNKIIEKHSFKINLNKISMRTKSDRQIVTGIVVNEYPNVQRKQIKKVRSMLHCWKNYGLNEAQDRYIKNFDINNIREEIKSINFINIVRGKLEHIRNVRNIRRKKLEKSKNYSNKKYYQDVWYKYFDRFEDLLIKERNQITIRGEGETDCLHLKKAYMHYYKDYNKLNLYFLKLKDYVVSGEKELKRFIEREKYVEFTNTIICIFDRDVEDVKKICGNDLYSKSKKNKNIYYMVLPSLDRKEDNISIEQPTLDCKKDDISKDNISIEQLYCKDDLEKEDKNGRRIYWNNEFEEREGKIVLKKDDNVWLEGKKDIWRNDNKIVNSKLKVMKIIEGKKKSIGLSKKDFARYIVKNEKPFDVMDFSEFKKIFDKIKEICSGKEKKI